MLLALLLATEQCYCHYC